MLHPIAGKSLVQHVWERCQQCTQVAEVIIATDDERIAQAAQGFGARAIMTSPSHPSGTDRIAEAAEKCGDFDSIINVQGDEPLISPALIDHLALELAREQSLRMITAAAIITEPELVQDPNVVKVVTDVHGDALYFSRSPLPFVRNASPATVHKRHLGIYGFRRDFLLEFVKWPPSMLEMTESLEQLRAMEHGVRLRVVMTDDVSPGVDTLEQALAVEARIQQTNQH